MANSETDIQLVLQSVIKYLTLLHIVTRSLFSQRGTRYCWPWHKHSFETNKLTMFKETEADFIYCNWLIKMARIIWFGSTSVDIGPAYVNNWKRLGCLLFWVYVKFGNSLKQKCILYLASKQKISARKYFQKCWCKYGLHQYLPQAQQQLVPLKKLNFVYCCCFDMFYYPTFFIHNIFCTDLTCMWVQFKLKLFVLNH